MKKICIISGYGKESTCKEINLELTEKQLDTLCKVGIATVGIVELCSGNPIYAADGITKAVQPIVDILIDLAEPVSYGFMCKGFMQVCSGKEAEGKKAIKDAAAGYLGIRFIPQIYDIIKGINL